MLTTEYIGQIIDEKYEIIGLIGQGGMGVVYLGQHIVIGKKVAVKFMHPEHAQERETVKRFYREAKAAAAIGHKNIIDIMDVGTSPQGDPYMVMEYLTGESLQSLIDRDGPVSLAAACAVLEPTLIALHAAHEKGIIHRDLKPENIFLVPEPGSAPAIKLIDFGISKFTSGGEHSGITKVGTAIGTVAYMSPEQARSAADIDRRADIYSVGVILYEMLTGELPFEGEHHNAMLVNMLNSEPRPPGEVYQGFPAEAAPLVMKTLSKNKEQRPRTALELLEELKRFGCFERRNEELLRYSDRRGEAGLAGQSLGGVMTNGEGTTTSIDVDFETAPKTTPGEWASTSSRARAARRSLFLGLAGFLGVAMIGALLFLYLTVSNEQPEPASNEPAAAPAKASAPAVEKKVAGDSRERWVEIRLEGLPAGAKIYYDDESVSANPFLVEKRDVAVPLRVVASGFEDFTRSVQPSGDMVINVEPKPLVDEQPAPPPPPGSIGEHGPKRKPGWKRKKKFKEGGRGTLYVEEFE